MNDDCTFSIGLPADAYCYCCLYTGSDGDGNGCQDTEIACLGCAEDGYTGAISLYADTDGSYDDIDLGTSDIQGAKVIPTNDPCAQADSDQDGEDDFSDQDDDNDDISDLYDYLNQDGCEKALQADFDGNGKRDLFDGSWDDLEDSDGDKEPDFCQPDFGCSEDSEDTDGNCISDEFDNCLRDEDGDTVPACFDCNDADFDSVFECWSDDYCAVDSDGDGAGLCDDCDDKDPLTTYECFSEDICSQDQDGDSYGYCLDCDDKDIESTTGCYRTFECSYDYDGDGFTYCIDCDDFDETVSTACHVCSEDADGDGVTLCDDCNDDNADISDCIQEPCEYFSCDGPATFGDLTCELYANDNLAEAGSLICDEDSNCCVEAED
ncbi:MAG: hypothetical protein Q7T11_03570 [Deltaproteobacteria bacterium]|nr:hypothetical protein [Deltaproteobacteria bacterium]